MLRTTQWIFPNMTFTCSGNVTQWTFRGRTTNNSGMVPMFVIWEEYINTVNKPNDYRLRERSGSIGELVSRGDSVYQYVLEHPLEVREGDIFGMYLPLKGAEELLVEFWNTGEGNAPESFFSDSVQTVIDLLPDSAANLQVNNAFFPLVTAEMNMTSQLVLHPATSSPSASNTLIFPTVSSDLTVSSSSSQQPMLTLIDMFATLATAIIPSPISTPMTGPTDVALVPVFIAVTVGVVAVVLLIVVVGIIMVGRRHKKHQACDIDTSTLQDQQPLADLHNPVYQGVMEPVVKSQGDNRTSGASYHMSAVPDQQSDLAQNSKASIVGEHYEMMDGKVPITNTENSGSSETTFAYRKDSIYEAPVKEEGLLYAQLKNFGIRYVSGNAVRIVDYLGSGQFGTVSKGKWELSGRATDVAVKMLKANSAETDKVKLLQEAAIMQQFSHPNIAQLYGIVISENTLMILIELLTKGDLKKYLITLRPNSASKADDYLGHTLLSFCRQIASGLSYLADKAFVHRDLAARNILMAADNTCKVADFGMSRDLMDENYYVAHGGKVPIKWTAPEALHFKKYSTASDVWSYGVVMYEIWSLGHEPFEGYNNSQAICMVDQGYRLAPPPGCPRDIYDIMIKCWHPTNSERPDATKIVQWLSCPDPQLLKWSEEDKVVHPEASLLGADLETAGGLYKELQETYCIVLQNIVDR